MGSINGYENGDNLRRRLGLELVSPDGGVQEDPPMRFSLIVLGWELLAIELGNTTAEVDEHGVDGGYLTSYPVGFVANHERPDDSGLPYREEWDD